MNYMPDMVASLCRGNVFHPYIHGLDQNITAETINSMIEAGHLETVGGDRFVLLCSLI